MNNETQLPPCPFCGGEAIIAKPVRYVRGEGVCCLNGTQGKCALGMAQFTPEQWSRRAAPSRGETQGQAAIKDLLGFLKVTPLKLNEADAETYAMLVSAVESELTKG